MTEDVVDGYSILTCVMAWCHWAITWTSFDQDPSCHMASLSQNELNKAYPEIPQHTEEYSTINSLFMETYTIVMSHNCAFTSFAASIVLCYVMLCYVMLCYVMLCYVMLCYVMGMSNTLYANKVDRIQLFVYVLLYVFTIFAVGRFDDTCTCVQLLAWWRQTASRNLSQY